MDTCRHGFAYNILPLTHSTILKGSLTWAAFCLASSSCLWLSKASCSALIFQRAKSRSWRCCCAYRTGKQVLTIQVKHKDVIYLSHWLQLPLKDLDLLCWGVSSVETEFLTHWPSSFLRQCTFPIFFHHSADQSLGDQLIQQTRINNLVNIRNLQLKILFLWNKTNHPSQCLGLELNINPNKQSFFIWGTRPKQWFQLTVY